MKATYSEVFKEQAVTKVFRRGAGAGEATAGLELGGAFGSASGQSWLSR